MKHDIMRAGIIESPQTPAALAAIPGAITPNYYRQNANVTGPALALISYVAKMSKMKRRKRCIRFYYYKFILFITLLTKLTSIA